MPADGDEPARALFREGVELARLGAWAEALLRFTRSNELRPHAVTAYNIGFSERALGHTTRARKWLRAALAQPEGLPKEIAVACQTYLREANEGLARVAVSVTPPGAQIALDGRPLELDGEDPSRATLVAGTRAPGAPEPVPTRFDLRADPGARTFAISHDGRSAQLTRELVAGANRALDLALDQRASVAPQRTPDAGGRARKDPPLVDGPSRRKRIAAITAWTLTGAGVLLGAGAASIALHGRLRLDDHCVDKACSGKDAELLRRANIAGDTATAAFALAGAALLTAVLLWYLPRRARRGPSAWLAPPITRSGPLVPVRARW